MRYYARLKYQDLLYRNQVMNDAR